MGRGAFLVSIKS